MVAAGAELNISPGQTVSLIDSDGHVMVLRGSSAGVRAPTARVVRDIARLETLRALIDPPPEGRTFGARRGGQCPAVEVLTSLDEVVRVGEIRECKAVARAALEAVMGRGGG